MQSAQVNSSERVYHYRLLRGSVEQAHPCKFKVSLTCKMKVRSVLKVYALFIIVLVTNAHLVVILEFSNDGSITSRVI